MTKNSLAIILPVHNEVHSLKDVIALWDDSLKNLLDCEYEFLICEDGSTDGTKELIIQLQNLFHIVNMSTEKRRGYGQAVIDGINAARADYILCIDSDGQCRPDDFINFWNNKNHTDFVMGWRYPRRDPKIRLIYSKMFFVLHRLLFPNPMHDPSCPFVLGRKSAFQEILPYLGLLREGFWWGFVGACVKLKKSLLEIKINHYARECGKTQVYRIKKMPGIIVRNILGLFKLKFG